MLDAMYLIIIAVFWAYQTQLKFERAKTDGVSPD